MFESGVGIFMEATVLEISWTQKGQLMALIVFCVEVVGFTVLFKLELLLVMTGESLTEDLTMSAFE